MLKVMHDEGILEKKELGVWKINTVSKQCSTLELKLLHN